MFIKITLKKIWFIAVVLPLMLQAQKIHLVDGRSGVLPGQFIVSKAGVSWVGTGEAQPTLLEWREIDLIQLARVEPEIEKARKKALLTNESTYFTIPEKVNHFVAFLDLPVEVKFNRSWKVTRRESSTYYISTEGFLEVTPEGQDYLITSGFVDKESLAREKVEEVTPYPISTTIRGLFMIIGDDRNSRSRLVIRELRKQPGFFENIIIGLQNLSYLEPARSREIQETIDALRSLSSGRPISIDAQRVIMKFVDPQRRT